MSCAISVFILCKKQFWEMICMIITKTQNQTNKIMQKPPPVNGGLNCYYSLFTIEVNDCAIISCIVH